MITISEAHYHRLKETVQLLHSNLNLLHPASHITPVYNTWKHINQQLQNLYTRLSNDLEQLIQTNKHLQAQNKESHDQISTLKGQLAEASRLNTMQHSQLAKNLAELNKYKQLARQIKAKSKQKDQLTRQKDQIIQSLSEKARKYKKNYYQQSKKVQKMETMLALLEVTQKSSAKEKELDEEMLQIEQELQDLQQDEGLNKSS